MCPPAILAGVGMAAQIGSQIAGHAAANAAADANEAAANEAAELQRRSLLEAKTQTQTDVAHQLFLTERQVRSARSLAAVGAGEAGVAGLSVQDVLRDIERDGIEFRIGARRQERRELGRLDRELTATEMQRRNRIAGAPRSSALSLGLGIAGSAINWAQFEASRTPPGDPDNAGPSAPEGFIPRAPGALTAPELGEG